MTFEKLPNAFGEMKVNFHWEIAFYHPFIFVSAHGRTLPTETNKDVECSSIHELRESAKYNNHFFNMFYTPELFLDWLGKEEKWSILSNTTFSPN